MNRADYERKVKEAPAIYDKAGIILTDINTKRVFAKEMVL